MNIKIVADSASDLYECTGVDYVSVPLRIVTDNKEYVDNKDLDIPEMVKDLKAYKGKSGTACPGQGEWLKAFGDADWVFCVTITSKLSGSYNAARLAKEEYEEEHPGRKVFIVDSLSTGPEMILIINKIKEFIDAGKSFEEICDDIVEYKKHTGLIFCLESLTNLANNGRVSHAVAAIAGVLGIRLVGIADEGVLNPLAKCRGEKSALSEIMKELKQFKCSGQKILINHCLNEATALKLKALIEKEYPTADVSIGETGGLCSFYAEKGGILVGFETK